MSASKARWRYIGSRAIGFVIQHLSKGLGSLPDDPKPQDVATESRRFAWLIRHFVPHPSRCSGPRLRAFYNASRCSPGGESGPRA